MISAEAIRQLSDDIAHCFQPEKIILFGSYAYGTPNAASDVDFLVIMSFEGKEVYKAVEILTQVNPRFAVDLLVRTQETVTQRLEWNDFFLQEVIGKGKVLYAARNH